jgi:hypothetical protein
LLELFLVCDAEVLLLIADAKPEVVEAPRFSQERAGADAVERVGLLRSGELLQRRGASRL